jgi:hypothetical protein
MLLTYVIVSMLPVTGLRPRKYRDLKRSIRNRSSLEFLFEGLAWLYVDLLSSVLYTYTKLQYHPNISSTLRFNQLTHLHPQHMSIYGYFEAFLGWPAIALFSTSIR